MSLSTKGAAGVGEAVPAGDVRRLLVHVDAMDCPTEEVIARAALAALPGAQVLATHLGRRELEVAWNSKDPAPVLAALAAAGLPATTVDRPTTALAGVPSRTWWSLGVAAVAAIAAEVLHRTDAVPVVSLALSAIAILLIGLGTYRKGLTSLRHGVLNMSALMSVAITGAVLIGEWPEAAAVMVLFTLAELIEALSLDRARHAIRGLMALAPDTAWVRTSAGEWTEQAASSVPIGTRILVKAGGRVPLDGIVVAGSSAVNQAPITGESLPVDKIVGDRVFAGTVNVTGVLEVNVSAAANASTLARIIAVVESAESAKAPTQRFVDRFARVYTPLVFAIALATAVLPPLLAGASWLDWLYKGLVLLVVGCPCALVISTPVTLVSGLTAAARRGILIKGGVHLEAGYRLKTVAIDKTGTVTRGRPEVVAFDPSIGVDPARVRALAAALAWQSDHPMSQAIAAYAPADSRSAEVSEHETLAGRGVRGRIDGHVLHLGNHRLIEEIGRCSPAVEARLEPIERAGRTSVVLADETGVLGIFSVADAVRTTSRAAVSELQALGISTVMLTGDNHTTATAIAREAGIDEVRAELLPTDKLRVIEQLAGSGYVGMVGDGVNDAPALARATIGFAMGKDGTDIALETADVVLMNDDLRKVPEMIRLSKRTRRILVENIALALGIKAAFLGLTVFGHATMWMAVFADMGASLIVVGNGLRLLRLRRTDNRPESV